MSVLFYNGPLVPSIECKKLKQRRPVCSSSLIFKFKRTQSELNSGDSIKALISSWWKCVLLLQKQARWRCLSMFFLLQSTNSTIKLVKMPPTELRWRGKTCLRRCKNSTCFSRPNQEHHHSSSTNQITYCSVGPLKSVQEWELAQWPRLWFQFPWK